MAISAPTDISGCVGWYRPSGISSSGDLTAVTGWTDDSGSANDLTQGTAGRRPVDVTGPRGRGVCFDYQSGQAKGLDFPSAQSFSQQSMSVYVVGEQNQNYLNQNLLVTGAGNVFNPLSYLAPGSSKRTSLMTPSQKDFTVAQSSCQLSFWGMRGGGLFDFRQRYNATAIGSTGQLNAIAGTAAVLGNTSAYTTGYQGMLFAVYVYDRKLTDQEESDLYDYAAALYSIQPSPSYVIVAGGDSRTAGVGSVNNYSWPYQSSYATAQRFFNMGLGGQTISTMDSNYASHIAPIYDSTKTCFLVCWAAQNDLYNAGASPNGTTVYNSIASYCGKGRATGFKVIVCTECDGAAASGGNQAAYDAAKVVMNNLIIANWTTFADAICRLDQVPQLSDRTNSTYFNDTIHQNKLGYSYVATAVDAAINQILFPFTNTLRGRRRSRSGGYPFRAN